ncbi:MAG: hypothetical protein DRP56_02605 [Planctomycetota bacterium]|nr:MAG: hypothetical protein DRP56_02605 [Planctomycetota bacterium]
MNTKLTLRALYISLCVWCMCISDVKAAEGGYSNYVPGTYGDFGSSVEPPTKWTIRNDYYNYRANGKESVRSGRLELDVDFEVNAHFLTVLYKPGFEIFGGRYATGIFLPTVVNTDIESGISVSGSRVARQDDVTKMGDATFIPGIFYWRKDNFHFSFAEYIIIPTGHYDSDSLANTGLNYWTFDTDFSMTYLNEKTGQDYSVNLGYNYNTENSDTNYQTGQEIHIDFMVNQFLSESFAVGVHGFYLKQMTGDSGHGAILGDFKSDAAGMGPALLWSPKKSNGKLSFIAKWLHEYYAKNRLEGDHVYFSIICSF